MRKFITRAALTITLVHLLLIIVVMSQPSDPTINEFFRLDDCEMPCWQGIQPGETRIDDAIDILQAHPWTENIEVGYDAPNQTGLVKWKWSAEAPFAAPDTGGLLNVRENLVNQIELETRIPLGEVWLRFGTPEMGKSPSIVGQFFAYIGSHRPEGINTETVLKCPLTPHSFWESATTLRYATEEFPGTFVDPRTEFRQICD